MFKMLQSRKTSAINVHTHHLDQQCVRWFLWKQMLGWSRKANALGVTPIEGNGRGRIGPGELSGSDADLTKFPPAQQGGPGQS